MSLQILEMILNISPATNEICSSLNPVVHELCIVEVAKQLLLSLSAECIVDMNKLAAGIPKRDKGSEEKYWGCFFCFIVFCIFAL